MSCLGPLEGGKATKRSRYGLVAEDRTKRTLISMKLCSKAKLKYHVIDSEWKWHYLMSHEVQELVNQSNEIVTILTFSSRHVNSTRILRQSLETLNETDRIGVNLVIGNDSFLSDEELSSPPLRSLEHLIKFVRRRFPNVRAFIGTEGIASSAVDLISEYDLIPFLLLDKDLKKSKNVIEDNIGEKDFAIYVPYLISENYPRLFHDILYRLAGYFMRRRWIQRKLRELGYNLDFPVLKEVLQEKKPLSTSFINSKLGIFLKEVASILTVYGDVEEVTERIRQFRKLGFKIIIGLPIKENEEQIESFGKCMERA